MTWTTAWMVVGVAATSAIGFAPTFWLPMARRAYTSPAITTPSAPLMMLTRTNTRPEHA